jgi:hypothetical protein
MRRWSIKVILARFATFRNAIEALLTGTEICMINEKAMTGSETWTSN